LNRSIKEISVRQAPDTEKATMRSLSFGLFAYPDDHGLRPLSQTLTIYHGSS